MKAAKKNIRMKQTDPYLEQKERLENFREVLSIKAGDINKSNLLRDIELVDLISKDLGTLEQDFKKPTVRVFRDETSIRIYGLEYFGGIALIYRKGDYNEYTLLTLGEDDETYYCYPRGWKIYESMVTYSNDTASFVNLLSEVLSTFNSIKK